MTYGNPFRRAARARGVRGALGAGLIAATLLAPRGARAQALTAALHGCGDGGILTKVETIEIIYWTNAPGTNPGDPSTYDDTVHDAQYIANYMSGLLGSTYTDTLTQYYEDLSASCSTNGPGGATNSGPTHLLWSHDNLVSPNIVVKVVTTPPPSGNWASPSLDDEHAIIDSLFPDLNAATNSETDVIVPILLYSPNRLSTFLFQNGVQIASAYHDRGTHGQAYISMPYQTSLPALSQILTHEYEETVTAPHDPPSGWYVVGSGELADVCENQPARVVQVIPTGTLPSAQSQVQPFWSRLANHGAGGCVYSWARGYDNFYVGGDGAVYAESGTNSTAARWGVPTYGGKSYTFTSPPSAVVWGGNHFDVVAMDSNDHISELYSYDAGNTISTYDWGAPPNSAWMGRPDVASWGNHREDLFAASGLWYVAGSPAIYHRGWGQPGRRRLAEPRHAAGRDGLEPHLRGLWRGEPRGLRPRPERDDVAERFDRRRGRDVGRVEEHRKAGRVGAAPVGPGCVVAGRRSPRSLHPRLEQSASALLLRLLVQPPRERLGDPRAPRRVHVRREPERRRNGRTPLPRDGHDDQRRDRARPRRLQRGHLDGRAGQLEPDVPLARARRVLSVRGRLRTGGGSRRGRRAGILTPKAPPAVHRAPSRPPQTSKSPFSKISVTRHRNEFAFTPSTTRWS